MIHAAQEVLGEGEFNVEDFKSMGSGRAPGGTCGALHAACEAAPEAADSIKMQFEAKNGATTCHELKRTYKVPCEQAIATAADLLQQHIKGNSDA